MTAKKEQSKKYTLWRTKEDIKKLEKLRECLRQNLKVHFYVSHNQFNTDSEIYKKLPDLYMDAVKKISDQDLAIAELTAKLDQLQQLRGHFCRILEICHDAVYTDQTKKSNVNVKLCENFDREDKECIFDTDPNCKGYNTKCKDYEPEEDNGK